MALFYLNYIIKDDLCRQFQSEALRLGFWPMNLVVPEAHFTPQHLSLDLRCSQIKTIDHLLSIPAGFPTAFELRHTPLLKSWNLFLHRPSPSLLRRSISQGIFPSQLPVPYLPHSVSFQCCSLCLQTSSSFCHFLFIPEGEFWVWAVSSLCFHCCRTLFRLHIFTVFFLGKIFQSKLESSTLTPRMFVYISPPLNSKN